VAELNNPRVSLLLTRYSAPPAPSAERRLPCNQEILHKPTVSVQLVQTKGLQTRKKIDMALTPPDSYPLEAQCGVEGAELKNPEFA